MVHSRKFQGYRQPQSSLGSSKVNPSVTARSGAHVVKLTLSFMGIGNPRWINNNWLRFFDRGPSDWANGCLLFGSRMSYFLCVFGISCLLLGWMVFELLLFPPSSTTGNHHQTWLPTISPWSCNHDEASSTIISAFQHHALLSLSTIIPPLYNHSQLLWTNHVNIKLHCCIKNWKMLLIVNHDI